MLHSSASKSKPYHDTLVMESIIFHDEDLDADSEEDENNDYFTSGMTMLDETSRRSAPLSKSLHISYTIPGQQPANSHDTDTDPDALMYNHQSRHRPGTCFLSQVKGYCMDKIIGSRKVSNRCMIVAILIILLVTAIAIAITMVGRQAANNSYTMESNPTATSPSPSQLSAPSSIATKLTHRPTMAKGHLHNHQQTFAHELVSSILIHFNLLESHRFENKTSPQFKAVQYLVDTSFSSNASTTTQALLNDPTHFNRKDWKKVQAICNLVELYSLAVLYFTTMGPISWVNTLGWLNPTSLNNPCTWFGIKCLTNASWSFSSSKSHTLVTHVLLNQNGLTGSIPTELQNLYSLVALDLSQNSLHGTVPPTVLWTLPSLEVVQLSGNQLTGSIPILPWWNTTKNNNNNTNNPKNWTFSGSLPSTTTEIQGGNQLKVLSLQDNHLEGSLPDIFGSWCCPVLESFHVGANNLIGDLHPLGAVVALYLKELILDGNQFTGNLSSILWSNTNTNNIKASQNSSASGSGSSRNETRPFLFQLTNLVVSRNLLTGSIPDSLGKFINLERLELNDNLLSGSFPTGQVLLLLTNLKVLDLSGNHDLQGSVPSFLVKQLEELRLPNNVGIGD